MTETKNHVAISSEEASSFSLSAIKNKQIGRICYISFVAGRM